MAKPERATEEIIQALQQGVDREANFDDLFDRYYNQVVRFFRWKGMSPEDARGLTQETFILVYTGIADLRAAAQFNGWLFRIALNVYRNAIVHRRRAKRSAPEVSLEDALGQSDERRSAVIRAVAHDDDPMQDLLEQEKIEQLRAALEELPDQMRRCMQLRVLNELPHQAIADVMGLSVNTVKAHLHQARKILQTRLRGYLFGEAEL
jgi:RNA polymerase sigma-70 factor (ECF subfamily)